MADKENGGERFGDGDLRVLFCIGVTSGFFEAEPEELGTIKAAIEEAFDDLSGRFGVRVLGTMDDDRLLVGTSESWPWVSYILADVPDLHAAHAVTDILRGRAADGYPLWRYLKIEARIGRPLFFGNE